MPALQSPDHGDRKYTGHQLSVLARQMQQVQSIDFRSLPNCRINNGHAICFAHLALRQRFGRLAALVFAYLLIAMTFIDADTQLLPDDLTLLLLWCGLL